ncbi:MAG: GldG family protein, partial [Lentisphaerae bacterium]|nr:GldG family protein [Lentisphaerota bacterium]
MKSFLAYRRSLTGLNAAVALALAALLVVMVNYLAARYPLRFDLSRAGHYELTAETRGLLRQLPPGVRIVVFMSGAHELYRAVQSLLREYEYAAPGMRVEYVDPHRDPGRSKELSLQYDLREPNVIVLDNGLQRRVVPLADLADYDYPGAPADPPAALGAALPARSAFGTADAGGRAGHERVLRQFRGEQALSTALQNLRQTRAAVVYFLTGHGERQIDNFDPATGYSIIARIMEKKNLELKALDLSGLSGVSADCNALVIAGPLRPLTRPEVEMIGAYLNNHGRLLLLVDPGVDCGLEKLLELWGVRLGSGRVVSSAMAFKQLLVSSYGAHPITARLKNVGTIFTMPRP